MEDWRWLCMAADQKHGKAMVETGNILWEGRDGVTQDREMAYCWYRSATESGNKDADSDVMAAEWILSDAEIESALTRCAEDNLPACEEILLSVPTQHKDTGQTLPDSQE
jgi:TPR repeat protein